MNIVLRGEWDEGEEGGSCVPATAEEAEPVWAITWLQTFDSDADNIVRTIIATAVVENAFDFFTILSHIECAILLYALSYCLSL